MSRLRTPGINFDTSGYANAAQLRVQGAQSVARGIEAVGQGVGSGLTRMRAAREKRRDDAEETRQFEATLKDRKDARTAEKMEREAREAKGLAEARARQEHDDLASAQRVLADELQAATTEFDAVAVEAMGRPDAMASTEWQVRLASAEAKAKDVRGRMAQLEQRRQAFAAQHPGLERAPRIIVPTPMGPIDVTDPAFRAASAEARVESVEKQMTSGRVSLGQRFRLAAALALAKREVVLGKEQAADAEATAKEQAKQARLDEAARLLREQFRLSPSFRGLSDLDADDITAQVAMGAIPVRSALLEARRRLPSVNPTPGERAESQAEQEAALVQARKKRGLPTEEPQRGPQTPAEQVTRERDVADERVRQGLAQTQTMQRAEKVAGAVREATAAATRMRRDGKPPAGFSPWGEHSPKDIAHALAHGALDPALAKDAAAKVTPAARETALNEWFEEQARLRRLTDDDDLADLLAEGQALYRTGGR